MIRKYLPKSTEELIHWYERYVSPVALIVGFLLDNYILLNRVDVLLGNILLCLYLFFAGLAIVVINIVGSGRIQNKAALFIAPFMPVMMQFFFGALFSGYLALYSKSAGVAVSWVFVLVLAVLLLGNERFRSLYQQLPFQISIYFTALYSFLIFFLPLIFKYIGPLMFLLSGVVSVIVITIVVTLLRRVVPERVEESQWKIRRSIFALVIVFNVLYFANLIPPLPLALKEGGVYHRVDRAENSYQLQGEKPSIFVRFLNTPATYHSQPGEKAYVFTAVFAPSGLSTTLRHEWQYYNDRTNTWETRSDVKFTIHGGRDGGFRGYSEKQNPEAGSWRVNVLTEYGQIIGRIRFTVVSVNAPAEITTITK